MGERGRKSGASISVLPVTTGKRPPEPPAVLTEAQGAAWRAVVADMPPDWFSRVPELLVSYCRHVSTAEVLTKEINAFEMKWLADSEGLKRYEKLLAMAARESMAMLSLATKMRLTQQSRFTPKAAATAADRHVTGRKPWEPLANA